MSIQTIQSSPNFKRGLEKISAQNPLSNSEIIYASIRPNVLGIYHHSQETGKVNLIGSTNRFDTHPTPTPDGKAVIYSSNGNGSHHLFIRSLETNTESKLSNHSLFEDHPCFDNNCFLYFSSDYNGEGTHIYRVKWNGKTVDMNEAEQITLGKGTHFSFCLSPSGKEIVFSSNINNLETYQGPQPTQNYLAGVLYKMEIGNPASCKRLIKETNSSAYWEGTPTYSQNGKFIFYYSTVNCGPHLYRYSIETQEVVKLTPDGTKAIYPETSSNNQILFSYQKHPEKPWKIKSMNFNGEGLKTVVKMQQHCWGPKIIGEKSLLFFGTTNLGKLPNTHLAPHGEGPFLVDQGNISDNESSIALKTIRGYFPTANKKDGKITYIDSMTKIMRCSFDGSKENELFNSLKENGSAIFGLSSSSNGTLVTSQGAPFGDSHNVCHIILIQGQKRINLTTQYGEARNAAPTISQNGEKIVFSRQLPGHRKHLFSMNSEGKELKQLTEENSDDVFPSFSPCGNYVAYSSTEDKKTYNLRLLNLADQSVINLTEGFVDIHVCFSPDGMKLVFTSNRGGIKVETPLSYFFNPQAYGDTFIQDINSRKITQITSSPYEDSTPTWV